ncbi:MAG: glycosyl transferase family 1 [Paenibacillaceae bacterium]|nr:glycosyl transferase family 1 [Paenibacillaceae bacterium]
MEKKSGLGKASREYVRALRHQGVEVRSGGNGGIRQAAGEKTHKQVLIHHHPPYTLNIKEARKRYDCIILNTVWETTRLPRRWMANINKFDAIFVPTQHNKDALRNSGVTVPVFIVPHGVDTRSYNPDNRKLDLGKHRGKFLFVSVFGFQHRKNPELLLRAYWEEFTADDRVLLLIKTNGYGNGENGAWIKNKMLRYKAQLALPGQTAPVMLISKHVSDRKLQEIYAAGNAFVLPTRGEGVGLPFLESIASGVPVIATGWGGQMDFLTAKNSFFVKYKLKNPAAGMHNRSAISRKFSNLFAQKGQRWAEADLHSLRKQMRLAYENPELCKRKGRQGRRDALALSWDRSGRLMKQAIERIIGRSNQAAVPANGRRLEKRIGNRKKM